MLGFDIGHMVYDEDCYVSLAIWFADEDSGPVGVGFSLGDNSS